MSVVKSKVSKTGIKNFTRPYKDERACDCLFLLDKPRLNSKETIFTTVKFLLDKHRLTGKETIFMPVKF